MNLEHPAIKKKICAIERLLVYLGEHAPYVDQPQGMAQGLARAYLYRAHNVLKAAHAIAQLGLPAEVLALARVLSESTIQLSWVSKGNTPDDRAQTLLDEAVIKAFDTNDIFLRHNPTARELTSSQERSADETRYNAARKRLGVAPGKKHKEKPIAERARECGTDEVFIYDVLYREMCTHAHASIQSLQSALDEPTEQSMDKALFVIIVSALGLLDRCDSILKLQGASTLTSEITPILEQSGSAVQW